MPIFRVVWEIDIFTEKTFESAAKEAFVIQRDPDSMATVFTVINTESGAKQEVDLQNLAGDLNLLNRRALQ